MQSMQAAAPEGRAVGREGRRTHARARACATPPQTGAASASRHRIASHTLAHTRVLRACATRARGTHTAAGAREAHVRVPASPGRRAERERDRQAGRQAGRHAADRPADRRRSPARRAGSPASPAPPLGAAAASHTGAAPARRCGGARGPHLLAHVCLCARGGPTNARRCAPEGD